MARKRAEALNNKKKRPKTGLNTQQLQNGLIFYIPHSSTDISRCMNFEIGDFISLRLTNLVRCQLRSSVLM